jgi:hypothetical protein
VQGVFDVQYPTNAYSAFHVDSASAVTTVRNVLNATNNDNQPTVAINGNDQAIYFANTSSTQTGSIVSDGSNNLTITATVGNLNLNSNNGDIYLSPDGVIRPQSNIYQADGYNINAGNNIYSKRSYIGGSDYAFDGYLDIRNAAGNLIFGVDAGHIADQGYNSYTVAGQIEVNAQINLNTEDGNPAGHLFTNQDGVIHLESNSDLAIRAGANGGSKGNIILYTGGTHGAPGKAFIGWNNDNGTYQQNEIATKGYVDSVASGLSVLGSVRTATDVNFDLTQVYPVIGNVTVAANDRVLVKAQTDATQNGIYVIDPTTSLLTLSTNQEDMQLKEGSYVLVSEGLYAAQGWIVTAFVAGASTWTQFSAAGEYTAGYGIDITSNSISVKLADDSLVEDGTGVKVNLNSGGAIQTDGGLYINVGTGLTTSGNQLNFATGYGVKKYAANNTALTASGGQVTWAVSHGIASADVTVQLRDLGTNALVEVDVVITDANTVTLSWVSGDVAADAYRVVVVG